MSTSLLLLDRRNIAALDNARLALGKVEKHRANPLFVEEYFADPPKPWEARLDNVYPSVIYDDEAGLFKCWYKSFIIDEASNTTALSERPRRAYFGGEREEGLLYASSVDGIHWEKPDLGLIEFEGSRRNNIVMRRDSHGIHAGGVLKDTADSDSGRRYKFIHRNLTAGRMATCYSADGLHWSQPHLWAGGDAVGDTHNNAIWAPDLGRYVCITRGWSEASFRGVRTVLRSESRDFRHWSEPVEIMRGGAAHDQIYSMPIARYGDLYIGLPAIFHKGDVRAPDWDTVDTELAISVDTLEWQRICPGEPLIPRGAGCYPAGEYDCGCVYAAAPVVRDKKILLYYGGSNGLHNNWREGSLNLATLAIDRFAGYTEKAAGQPARIESAPLRLTGQDLRLNADVQPNGRIRAAVYDVSGSELPGLGFEDCCAIAAGGLGLALCWRDRSAAALAGKSFRLVLELNAATGYAIYGASRVDD